MGSFTSLCPHYFTGQWICDSFIILLLSVVKLRTVNWWHQHCCCHCCSARHKFATLLGNNSDLLNLCHKAQDVHGGDVLMFVCLFVSFFRLSPIHFILIWHKTVQQHNTAGSRDQPCRWASQVSGGWDLLSRPLGPQWLVHSHFHLLQLLTRVECRFLFVCLLLTVFSHYRRCHCFMMWVWCCTEFYRQNRRL